MLAGSSGFRLMPRKMAGIATITIDPSMVAIVMLSVVLDRAIHLYRSGRPTAAPDPFDAPFRWFVSVLCRTFTQPTAEHLLNDNYLLSEANTPVRFAARRRRGSPGPGFPPVPREPPRARACSRRRSTRRSGR